MSACWVLSSKIISRHSIFYFDTHFGCFFVVKYSRMSGHSKWSTIRHQKGVKDARRGQLFTKLGRAITVAVIDGGGITDPDKNFKLRLTIERARSMNMPKDNIERAVKRGTGEGGEGVLKTITYEGYGPSGVAILLEASTDNTNRTSQEIKSILEDSGGRLAGPGSVAFQFEAVGFLTIAKPGNVEETVLKIIDLGAQDVEEVQDGIEIYTKPGELEKIKESLEKEGLKVQRYELFMRPKTEVKVDNEASAKKIINLMERLEDQDDVSRVFANFDIPDEILKEAAG